MKITTGFLTGNLLTNAPHADEGASARRFARSLHSAITRRYPEAEVTIGWCTGSGFLPQELWTAVDDDPGHGEVAAVDFIVGEVIRGGDYLVRRCCADSAGAGGGTPGASRRPPAPFAQQSGEGCRVSPLRLLRPGGGVAEALRRWVRGRAARN